MICCKHLPQHTPAVQTCAGDGTCRLFQKLRFWEGTLILLTRIHQKAGKLIQKRKGPMTAPVIEGTDTLCTCILLVKVFLFHIGPTQTWKSLWVFSSSASSSTIKPSGRAKASLCLPGISGIVMWPWRWDLMCNSLDDAEENVQNIPTGYTQSWGRDIQALTTSNTSCLPVLKFTSPRIESSLLGRAHLNSLRIFLLSCSCFEDTGSPAWLCRTSTKIGASSPAMRLFETQLVSHGGSHRQQCFLHTRAARSSS